MNQNQKNLKIKKMVKTKSNLRKIQKKMILTNQKIRIMKTPVRVRRKTANLRKGFRKKIREAK